MKRWLAILAALALGGCAVVRHDAAVRSVFPEEGAFADGIPVAEEWAREKLKGSEVEKLKSSEPSPDGELKGSEVEKLKSSEPFNCSTVQPFNSRKEGGR